MASTKATRRDEEAARILNMIRQLVRALRLYDRAAQTKHGISAAQMFVLHVLNEGGTLSLNEVAERTATDQSSASVVVQKLVTAGFVSRTSREDDRRHIDLKLTTRGRSAVRRAPPAAQQKLLEAVERMSPRDRKEFVRLFEQFVGAFGVRGRKVPMMFEDDVPTKRR